MKIITEKEHKQDLKEIGYYTALNNLEDLIEKGDDAISIKKKINKLRFSNKEEL